MLVWLSFSGAFSFAGWAMGYVRLGDGERANVGRVRLYHNVHSLTRPSLPHSIAASPVIGTDPTPSRPGPYHGDDFPQNQAPRYLFPVTLEPPHHHPASRVFLPPFGRGGKLTAPYELLS